MALLEARGLVKQFGRRTVVDQVTIEVRAGEIVGLLGPNGAGKTTSFNMIVGIVPPTAGQVFFAGHDITERPMYERARLGLGYLAQQHSIFRKLTVEQNLYAILELMTMRRGKPFRSSARERKKRVEQLLEQFGLTKVRKNLAMYCSGGEKRRLEIARCLISEPMLIMLDEPFAQVDPVTVEDIQKVIRGLRDDGISILITDHKAVETLRITDRSYLVAAGKVLVHGAPSDLINHPDARRVYFGEGVGDHFADDRAVYDPPSANRLNQEPPAPSVAIPTPSLPPRPSAESLRSFLALDEISAWVDGLATPEHAAVGERIRSRGYEAVPALLGALSRPDATLRSRAHRLLCEIVGVELPFDPFGAELMRTEQIGCIRDYLYGRRQAG